MDKIRKKGMYKVLFLVLLIYSIWSIVVFGFEGYKPITIGEFYTQNVLLRFLEFLIVVGGNVLNYGFRIALPIWSLYAGFIKK